MGWGKKFMQTIGLAAAIGSSEQAMAKEKMHESTQPSNKEDVSHHETRETVDPFAAARTEAIDLINNGIDDKDSFGTRLVGKAKMELVPPAEEGGPLKVRVTVESNGQEITQTYVVTVDKETGAKSFATNEKTGQVEDEDDMRIRQAAEATVAAATGKKDSGGVSMNK